MRVLLVCDNPRVALQVLTGLNDGQATIAQVAAPQRALRLLDEDEAFDIVIADADTAPTGGMALSREIKARGHMGRDMPPVVLLLARNQDRWLSNWAQADAYMLKPIDPFDLAETVAALLAGQEVPDLPGVGGAPAPSPFDRPTPATEELEGVGESHGR